KVHKINFHLKSYVNLFILLIPLKFNKRVVKSKYRQEERKPRGNKTLGSYGNKQAEVFLYQEKNGGIR
ncbi:hypothetical protein M3J54_25380, partial [Enterobacter hormaechei]|uniref:hypothetical protein n=1 Tax=Enterobacter hormaechei TaxID=158836 RepID=UPI00200D553A